MTQLINYYYNFDVMFRVDLIDSVSLTDSVYLINFGVDIISDYPCIWHFFYPAYSCSLHALLSPFRLLKVPKLKLRDRLLVFKPFELSGCL